MLKKTKFLWSTVILALVFVPLIAWCGGEKVPTEKEGVEITMPAGRKPLISYIVPPLDNVYWVTVKNEAERWANRLNVDLIFKGGDAVEQLSILDDMITRGVDAIII